MAMKTASQILKSKWYDNAQVDNIIGSSPGLDMTVRKEFGVEDEPIQLLDDYILGEADEDIINKIAIEYGYDSCAELLMAMDKRICELAENYPSYQK